MVVSKFLSSFEQKVFRPENSKKIPQIGNLCSRCCPASPPPRSSCPLRSLFPSQHFFRCSCVCKFLSYRKSSRFAVLGFGLTIGRLETTVVADVGRRIEPIPSASRLVLLQPYLFFLITQFTRTKILADRIDLTWQRIALACYFFNLLSNLRKLNSIDGMLCTTDTCKPNCTGSSSSD